jgi:hypothetical protein
MEVTREAIPGRTARLDMKRYYIVAVTGTGSYGHRVAALRINSEGRITAATPAIRSLVLPGQPAPEGPGDLLAASAGPGGEREEYATLQAVADWVADTAGLGDVNGVLLPPGDELDQLAERIWDELAARDAEAAEHGFPADSPSLDDTHPAAGHMSGGYGS